MRHPFHLALLDGERRDASAHRPVASSPLVTAPAAMLDRLRHAIGGRHEEIATDTTGLLDAQAQRVVDVAASLSSRGGRMLHRLDPAAARRQPTLVDAVSAIRSESGSAGRSARERTDDVAIAGPHGSIRLRLHRPDPRSASPIRAGSAVADRLPVYIHVHGGGGLGGGVVGGLDLADGPCRAVARQAGCLAVAVEYRLAPEHPFPAGHDDVLAALRWAMSDAAVFGADTRRVAIGGEGIGATMAAAAAVQVRATGRGPVALVLVTPMTAPSAAIEPSPFPSWRDAVDAHPMSSAVARRCLGHLVSDPADLDDPRLSLLSLPDTTLARFPPTLVLTAERDPWRDEGAAFAAALRGAGVDVEHTRYDGVMHGFFVAADVIDRAAIAQTQVAAALCRAFDPGHLWGAVSSPEPPRGRTGGLGR